MRKFLILACLTAPATPALADTWTAPQGCEAFLTVQAKACRVSHYYKCSADAPGDQWRVDLDQEGPFFYSRINSEAEWVESYDPVKQVLDPNPADPARFSELLAEGIDTWSFSLSREDGQASRAEGYDRLTGQSVVIDGIPCSRPRSSSPNTIRPAMSCAGHAATNTCTPTGACSSPVRARPTWAMASGCRSTAARSSSSFPAKKAFWPASRSMTAMR